MKSLIFRHLAKKSAIFSCILIALLLSGCSAEDFILHQFSDMSEEDYQKYIELKNTNQLDENGCYISAEINDTQETLPPENSIHVTFAENKFLEISYFSDAELSKPIDPDTACYLNPNDCIYASEPVCNHPSSNWYSFDRFCIYAYDNDQNKMEELSWSNDSDSPSLVLRIPSDYEGTEISVAALGKYENRTLKLTDYYIDSTGNKQELSGTWIVNDKEVTGETIDVSPINPFFVDFHYDADKYCYISSEPYSYYHENGLVRFDTTYADNDIDTYSVELYSLEDTMFLFDPALYPAEHGSVSFEYNGRTITEKCLIKDGDTISYKALPDSGYHHPEPEGKIIVYASAPDKTNEEIKKSVTFYSDQPVSVILPRPIGGTIEYIADGKILSGNTCTLYSGTTITMNFTNWNGWNCNVMNNTEYIVTEQDTDQTVTIDSIDIYNDVFEENDEHKPTLDVILTDSIKNAKFEVSASGISRKDLSYESENTNSIIPEWLGKKDRLIFSDKIGTEQGITLTITDDTIFNDSVLKLDIVMEDTKNNKYYSIRYIESLPVKETIPLYDETEIADSSIVYNNVKITVSKTEKATYHARTMEHAEITAKLIDVTEPYILKEGDPLEPSRNIEIMITPANGYYIADPQSNNDTYSETMEYSKWEKNYKKILDKHPIKKIWSVTLDDTDSYGTCVYKLDGEIVSGSINIYEGQKLTLDYTLTDPDFQISRNGVGGFFGGLLHNDTESCTIPVTEALDGQTVKRTDYIAVEQKE